MDVASLIPNDVLIKETLKAVNEWRVEEGREALTEMPKGRPDNVLKCPVARAMQDEDRFVYSGQNDVSWGTAAGVRHKKYPDAVLLFIRRFDAREIPELLEES